MSEMISQCPKCMTSFRVTENQLRAAGGRVRCGYCMNVFMGQDYLISGEEGSVASEEVLRSLIDPGESFTNEAKPANKNSSEDAWAKKLLKDLGKGSSKAKGSAAGAADASGFGYKEILVDSVPETEEDEDEGHKGAGRGGVDLQDSDIGVLPQHLDIEEPGQRADTARGVEWKWIVGALAMVLLFCAEYSYFYWDDLTADRKSRRMLSSLCSVAGCQLPVYQDLRAVSTDQLTVRSHPDADSALIVDIIVTNNAELSQPFPVLQLTFFDIRSQPVATRQFDPGEYLDGELRGLSSMPTQSPIRLALEILDPGADAINYELKLLPLI